MLADPKISLGQIRITMENKTSSKDRPLCLAIVGLGSIGRRHLRLLNELQPNLRLLSLRSVNCMQIPEESLVSKTYYEIDNLLQEEIDAAIIATPASNHLRDALAFNNSAIKLLIEKPICVNLDELTNFKKTFSNPDDRILVGYVIRYDASSNYFKKIIQSICPEDIVSVQVISSSYLPEWRAGSDYRKSVSARRELGGGVLLELSHEIDYLLWFFGELSVVSAASRNTHTLDIDVEDEADVILQASSGFIINLHMDFNSRICRRFCVVKTKSNEIRWDFIKKSVEVEHFSGQIDKVDFPADRDAMYKNQLNHFLDFVMGSHEAIVGFKDGENVIKLLEIIGNIKKEIQ